MAIAVIALLMLAGTHAAHVVDCELKLVASYDMVADAEPIIVVPMTIAGTPRYITIDTGSFANCATENFVDEAKLEHRSVRQDMKIYGAEGRVTN